MFHSSALILLLLPVMAILGNSLMTNDEFRNWRKEMGLKQKEAAELLGLKKRMIQYYEKGNRDGKDVEIPKTVELACYALSRGISKFDGRTATNSFAGLGTGEDVVVKKK